MPDVSPGQGHGSFAPLSVNQQPVHSLYHSSRPILLSQFRGPHIFNMAETEEERAKREEEERKAKDDADKQSNFKKVQEAREKAEAERDALLKEKRDREEADKKAHEEKLAADKRFEELAQAKEKEAAEAKAEAEAAKKDAEAAKASVKAFEDQLEKDLEEVLKTIPDDKKPPLDPTDPVAKRLQQARFVQSLLSKGPKPPVGGGHTKTTEDTRNRIEQLRDIQKTRPLTEEEAFEEMSLAGEQ